MFLIRIPPESPLPAALVGRASRPAARPFTGWREVALDFAEAEALALTMPVYRGWHRVQGCTLIEYNLAGPDKRQLFPTPAAALAALLRYPLRPLSPVEVETIGRADGMRDRVAPRA